MEANQLITEIIPVHKLLQYKRLAIPIYQRPYKWTQKNVRQLIKDISFFKNQSAYRLGTIVIHNDGSNLNIVDGQQRTITLIMITRVILKRPRTDFKNPELRSLLQLLEEEMFNPKLSNEISIDNIKTNYQLIEKEEFNFEEELILFLFNQCEVIQFVLKDISEAFQFFDAQNSRGRELEPHDLLKAFHLRVFSPHDDPYKVNIVTTWETMHTEKLASLFSDFLFRVRSWCRGQSARYFTKNEVDLFKVVNIDRMDAFAYAMPLRIIHRFVDNYNINLERQVDMKELSYPFQPD